MPTGWHSWCLACASEYDKERHQKNQNESPEYRAKAKTKSATWYRQNKEKALARQREYNYLVKYGITVDQYHALVTHQGGGCGICGRPNNSDPRRQRFGIDHDHQTGNVRGALCDNCNRGLGLFGDDPDRLQRAIDYLRAPPFDDMP
jgi:hypothetical protein